MVNTLPDFPEKKHENAEKNFFLPIAILIFSLLTIFLVIYFISNQRLRELANNVKLSTFKGSELVVFSEKDVEIRNKWSPITGILPTVSFSAKINSAIGEKYDAKLYYSIAGQNEWSSIDANKQKGNSCNVKVRDMMKNMPYDCFFVVYTSDTVLYSDVVRCVVK